MKNPHKQLGFLVIQIPTETATPTLTHLTQFFNTFFPSWFLFILAQSTRDKRDSNSSE